MSYLTAAYAWAAEHWAVLVIGAALVAKILNKVAGHWSERRGLVRWCLFLVDVLDLFKSTPAPSPVGRDVKPGSGSPNPGGLYVLLPLALLLGAQGCGWERAARISLASAYDVAKIAESTAIPTLHELAMSEAKKCAAAVPVPQVCAGKDKWQDVRHTVEGAIGEVYRVVLLGRTAVLLGEEKSTEGLLIKLGVLISALRERLSAAGVLP